MIYTFYSYKGGVGRSMALANIAQYLCAKGLRVLMIDWDLEAPGLEAFFDAGNAKVAETIASRPGLMDMLAVYKRLFPRLPLTEVGQPTGRAPAKRTTVSVASERLAATLQVLRDSLSPLQGMLQPVPPAGTTGSGQGELWLLSAGSRSPENLDEYVRSVQNFDWAEFYRAYEGEAYFDWLREQLKGFDVTLIDSRTGVTEMGGVCARQLADVVVSFCAPNSQNLRGVASVNASFRRDYLDQKRGAPLQVVVVPARLDSSEIDRRNAFEEQFRRVLAEVPEAFRTVRRTFWDLRIPYIAKYAYMEQLAVGASDSARELEDAYVNLALHLALLAPEGSALRRCFVGELRREFPTLLPAVFVVCADRRQEQQAHQLSARIAEAGISTWQSVAVLAGDDPQKLLSLLENARHVVLLLAPEAAAAAPVRQQWHEARQRGIWVHLVGGGWPPPGPPRSALPAWVRNVDVRDPEKDWDALLAQLRSQVAAPRVPQMAPAPPRDLVDRNAEIDSLRAWLAAGEPAVALWGLGGSGKTVLAAAACREDEVLAAFDGILWAFLGRGSDAMAEMAKIHAALTGEPAVFSDLQQATAKLALLLGGRRCLLVLDDVADANQVGPWKAVLGRGSMLVTTRDLQVANALSAKVVTVGEMTRDESARLLASQVPSLARSSDLEALTEMLGGLPLMLRLANARMQSLVAGTDGTAAVAQLRMELEARGVGAFDQPGTSDVPSLALTLDECLDRLPRGARQRFGQLATASPGPWSPSELQQLWGLPAPECTELIKSFADLALVTGAADAGFRVQPLLRSYLQLRRSAATVDSAIDRAKDVLRGKMASFDELMTLAARLKRETAFGYARRILWLARQHADLVKQAPGRRLFVTQQLALCTYKDVDLPAGARFDRALEIIGEAGDLATATNPETLGLAGAVYKRKWEVDGQKQHLERALAYYLRGSRNSVPSSPDYDYGFTGINAAFVLDLLASLEETEAEAAGVSSESAMARRKQARTIREQLFAELSSPLATPEARALRDQWWFVATLIEICIGLQRFEEARAWAAQTRSHQVAAWEVETTARQLAWLALITSGAAALAPDSPASRVLSDLLGGDEEALQEVRLGKLGLALSGGGFRASLFHIGVLARLAELDVLRKVQVVSCVSGGSIIGAHYYLEVRALLEQKLDREICRQDYVDIVARIAKDFLAGVQTNIRMSASGGLLASLKMSFNRNYSRTERVGELYESRLFRRAAGYEAGIPSLDGLVIHPRGELSDFTPKWHNWRRRAKVPILILNATTLNTGHNWQFTASFMGEPPGRIDTRVDGNDRLRRMYYPEAPPRYRHISLGQAVAASSCVPGLFEPLAFPGLYPDRVVRLVDGGVHDNQGTAALIEQDCSVMLVSDGSGQMESQRDPARGVLGPPLRANTILQARVRDAQYHELEARGRSALLRGLMFVHLKKDLDTEPVDWIGCDDPFDAADGARQASRRGVLTSYGIRKEVQAELANLRTDLDSFSDMEAFALMTSGYRMTEREFNDRIEGLSVDASAPVQWPFLVLEAVMRSRSGEGELTRLTRVLRAGSKSAFKVLALSRPLEALARAGLVLAAAVLLLVLYRYSLFGPKSLVALILLGAMAMSGLIMLPINLALCLSSRLGLLFNGKFLRQGRVAAERLGATPRGDGMRPG